MSTQERNNRRDAAKAREEAEVLARMLDALANEDAVAFRAVLSENPHLRAEYEGLDDFYRQVRAEADTDPLGPEYGRVAAELDRWVEEYRSANAGTGELTEAMRNMRQPEAQQLFEALALSIVVGVLGELGRAVRPDEASRIAQVLCSRPVQRRLRRSEHVRDGIIAVLAEQLQDASVPERITRERLAQIMRAQRRLNNLEAFERWTTEALV